MSVALVIAKLRAHPDAFERLGPDSAGRANGFQMLAVFADGAVKVTYHWGSRSFSGWEELEGWLDGRLPASWSRE